MVVLKSRKKGEGREKEQENMNTNTKSNFRMYIYTFEFVNIIFKIKNTKKNTEKAVFWSGWGTYQSGKRMWQLKTAENSKTIA